VPRSSEATRTRILDAAYALFRRRGYTRVSMDEIAAATAVTKRTLYYHFRSKDELLAAVLETQHRLALAAFRTFGDSLAALPRPSSTRCSGTSRRGPTSRAGPAPVSPGWWSSSPICRDTPPA